MRPLLLLLTVAVGPWLASCDLLGIDTPEKIAATRDAEGRAIGSACRHAGRAIEDCYTMNKKADKAAVFAGWRDMNDYMRENKIEPVVPILPPKLPKPADEDSASSEEASASASSGAKAKGKGH